MASPQLAPWAVPYVERPSALSPKARLVHYRTSGKTPRYLGPALRQTFMAIAASNARGLTTPELAAVLEWIPINTIRWATQVLRQQQYVRTVPTR